MNRSSIATWHSVASNKMRVMMMMFLSDDDDDIVAFVTYGLLAAYKLLYPFLICLQRPEYIKPE